MAEWNDVALPPTHVFVTLAHRSRHRTLALPRWLLGVAAAALVLAGLWFVGCTVYVAGHDSLLANLIRRERDSQLGYEDRITALQRDLDRATSRYGLLERTVSARLDLLTTKEADLRRDADLVAGLTHDFLHGPVRLGSAKVGDSASPHDAGPAPAAGRDEPGRDHAEDTTLDRRLGARLGALAGAFDTLETDQSAALAALQSGAETAVGRYRSAFEEAGLSPSRLGSKDEAKGGPFVPLDAASAHSPFDQASLSLRATLGEVERLQRLAAQVPFGRPLAGEPEVTSPFGARIDPFLGRPALHTGVDLRDEEGAAVRATAPGRVSFAGNASGYGAMVEIDHGNGLATRYAHLSSIAVSVGDAVRLDDVVGRVGATGRATGPHLHYETRIDGEPVDPMRFLAAGRHLADAGRS